MGLQRTNDKCYIFFKFFNFFVVAKLGHLFENMQQKFCKCWSHQIKRYDSWYFCRITLLTSILVSDFMNQLANINESCLWRTPNGSIKTVWGRKESVGLIVTPSSHLVIARDIQTVKIIQVGDYQLGKRQLILCRWPLPPPTQPLSLRCGDRGVGRGDKGGEGR